MANAHNPENEEAASHEGSDHPRRPVALDIDQSSIPSWVKTTGAFVGILAALSGAFVGVYQVLSTVKQFDVQIAKEQNEKAKEDRQAADAKLKLAGEENRGQEQLKQKELELKQTELQTETEKRKSMELAMTRDRQSQELLEQFKVDAERRSAQRENEKQLSESIGNIFGGSNASSPLASLSRYATPTSENLSTVLTPLVAKLDEVKSPTEINIIFQLFNKSGPRALNAVLDSNRIAFDKYKKDIRDVALIELTKSSSERLVVEDKLTDIVSADIGSNGRESNILEPLIRGIVHDVAVRVYSTNGALSTGENLEGVVKHLKIQAEILNQSKRSFLRLLDSNTKSMDLSGTDLSDVKFPPFSYRSITFRDAYVVGADLSSLTLDRDSVLSIWEADVGTFGRNPELILRAVRLSNEQRRIFLSALRS